MEGWAVARTQPHLEIKAVDRLRQKSHEAYCPIIQTVKYLRGKKRCYRRALFGGYIFVKISEDWHELGIFLMNGERPARIADDYIARLRASEHDGFIRLPIKSKFKFGERVSIKNGEMKGLVGIYHSQSTKHKERILLSLLGRLVPIHIDIDNLISVPG